MEERFLKALEFDKIRQMLVELAISQKARDKASDLMPSLDIKEVQFRQEETSEAQKILITKGDVPFGVIKDLRGSIKKAQIGSTLDPKALLNVADTMRTSRRVKNFILNLEEYELPKLKNLCNNITNLKELEEEIERAIISEEEISDNASSELRKIRNQISQTQNNIRVKLNNIVNSSSYAKILQDTIVTIRSDRFVLPVKAQNRADFPGIVHDSSASGATLFIEPMVIVEQNNALSQLKIKEKKEIERILQELTLVVGENYNEILTNLESVEVLDFIMAKGKLSVQMKALEPKINQDKFIYLVNARHPLIDKDVVVPSTIEIGKMYSTLVITGPNTGGKTVTLKTTGLLMAMAQSGLHIPTDYGSNICIVSDIFADIGDEQSIEQSLSTFSAHMKNIVYIMSKVKEDSLVLFDELGSGTDPIEGAALAVSILEKLKEKSILTVATTHYSELKNYALTTKGVENASVEFDVETLSPTFKLLIGIPGKSNAFEISSKLGLPPEIIEKARDNIKNDNIQMEDILAQLEQSKKEYIEKNQEINEIYQEAQMTKLRLSNKEERQKEQREKIINQAKDEAKKIINQAKEESQSLIKKINRIKKDLRTSDLDRDLNILRDQINKTEDKYHVEQKLIREKRISDPVTDIKEGMEVYVPSFGKNATVVAIEKNEVVVQMGAIKINVSKKNLAKPKKEKTVQSTGAGKIMKSKTMNAKSEIDLRGMDLETAKIEVDKYLDDCYVAGLKEVTIIHGVGTLVLKNGLEKYFKKHRHVKKQRTADYSNGGMGATIITLK